MKNTYVRVFSVLALVLLLLIGATVLGVAEFIFPTPIFFGLTFLGWLLVIYGLFGHITAIQRFVMGIKELNAQNKK